MMAVQGQGRLMMASWGNGSPWAVCRGIVGIIAEWWRAVVLDRDNGGGGAGRRWGGAWAVDGPIRAQRAGSSPDREQHDRRCRQDGHGGHRLLCRPVQGNIVFQVIRPDPMTPKIGFHFVGQVATNGKA